MPRKKLKISGDVKTTSDRLLLNYKWLIYKFDQFMEQPGSTAVFIIAVTLIVVVIGGLILISTFPLNSFGANVVTAWRYVTDPTAHLDNSQVTNPDGSIAVSLGPFFAGLFVTIAGLVVTGMLIGFLTDGISSYMDYLRRGDGDVIEKGHFLVLGWNDKLPAFIKSCAKADRGHGTVVILADLEKEFMDYTIGNIPLASGDLKIITRKGSPLSATELEKVSPSTARAIIVLADDALAEETDTHSIMKVVSVLGKFDIKCHIVAEVLDESKYDLMQRVGGKYLAPILSPQLVSRLLCQCGRQAGLAQCYLDIIDFGGSEFYNKKFPELDNKSFGEAVSLIDDNAVLCGIITKDSEGKKLIKVNPPDSWVFKPGDRVVVLAEDFDSYGIRKKSFTPTTQLALPTKEHEERKPKNFLIIGWRHNMPEVIQELDGYSHSGSTITILDKIPLEERILNIKVKHCSINHIVGNPLSYNDIQPLFRESALNTVFVVCDKSANATLEDSVHADNKTVVTTLILNDILRKEAIATRESAALSEEDTLVVSEIEKMSLVAAYQDSPCDWVVGNELVGMVIAQIAHDLDNRYILDELLTPDGNDIYLNHITQYVKPGTSLTFYELYLLGRRKTDPEIVVGYKKKNECVINPLNKHEKICLENGDYVIVISML